MRARAAVLGVCLLGLAGTAAAAHPRVATAPGPAGPYTLVELGPAHSTLAVAALRGAGATLVSSELAIWRLPRAAVADVLPGLRRAHLVRRVAADRTLQPLDAGDRVVAARHPDWWVAAMGAAGLRPPGPGRPVTVVDTGLDLSQPDFAGRPNTVALNRQQTSSPDDWHGTAISSLIGGEGKTVLGLYPRARLLEWDASEGTGLTLSAIIAGIEAATRAGPGVINLSLGSAADVPMLDDAILAAFHAGSIVVAAGGDFRGFDFSPYPASYPHVVAVAATDRRDRAASFTSPSSTTDVAAPGVGIRVAVPASHDPTGEVVAAGTSYSAALVSAALAWIWTRRPALDNTQLVALVRRTARKVGSDAFSNDTGYGVLDVRAALAAPAPEPDPTEPNDDIDLVRSGGVFGKGGPLLTSPAKLHAFLRARLDQNKDPADVYRAWIPAHGSLAVSVRAGAGDVTLRIWGPKTPTILERGGNERRDLLETRRRDGVEQVDVPNAGATGELVYVDVSAGVARTASYSLTLAARRP